MLELQERHDPSAARSTISLSAANSGRACRSVGVCHCWRRFGAGRGVESCSTSFTAVRSTSLALVRRQGHAPTRRWENMSARSFSGTLRGRDRRDFKPKIAVFTTPPRWCERRSFRLRGGSIAGVLFRPVVGRLFRALGDARPRDDLGHRLARRLHRFGRPRGAPQHQGGVDRRFLAEAGRDRGLVALSNAVLDDECRTCDPPCGLRDSCLQGLPRLPSWRRSRAAV